MTITAVSRTPRTARAQQPVQRQQGISVLPAVDVNLGSVTFFTPGGHHMYWSAQPAELVEALTQAVRPAQWIPEIGTLVVTVAQTGNRSGRRWGFRLAAR